MWSVMNSGPVAQFIPNASGLAYRNEAHIASVVCPAIDERLGEVVVVALQMLKAYISRDRDRLPRRTHRTCNKSWLMWCRIFVGRIPGKSRRRYHQFVGLVSKTIVDQVALGAIERVGFNNVGASFQVQAMNV